MTEDQLIHKIAQLESYNDQLLSELEYLDSLTKELGFINGLESLKSAAVELINEQNEEKATDLNIS